MLFLLFVVVAAAQVGIGDRLVRSAGIYANLPSKTSLCVCVCFFFFFFFNVFLFFFFCFEQSRFRKLVVRDGLFPTLVIRNSAFVLPNNLRPFLVVLRFLSISLQVVSCQVMQLTFSVLWLVLRSRKAGMREFPPSDRKTALFIASKLVFALATCAPTLSSHLQWEMCSSWSTTADSSTFRSL